MNQELYDKTNIARDKLYQSLGEVEPHVLSHLINPSLFGMPQWPSGRQAFQIIRRKNSTLVASDGLSDPFNGIEQKNTGYGVEFIAETKIPIEGNISDTWLLKVVYSIAQQAAYNGKFHAYISNHGVTTMELYAEDDGLELFQNENGMVGVMLGIEHPDIPKVCDFPGGSMILTTVQILTPEELSYAVENNEAGRKKINKLLCSAGQFHFIDPNRPSQIKTKPTTRKSWWSRNK